MRVAAVMFDIGDVLELNPRTGWQGVWCERLSVEPAEFTRRLAPIWSRGSVGAITPAQVEYETAQALGLDRPELAALMADLWNEYIGTLNRPLAAYFAALRPRYRTGIVSNSFVGAREREQAAYGFDGLCDAIIYSHEVGCMKPDPRIYRLACLRLGVPVDQTIFLDDVQANIDGAAAIGLRAIRFTGNAQAIAAIDGLLAAG